ncbi:hypothetical protein I5V28_16160 [Stenotrophomonas maltophilia]|uniref:hypothetical protein n=1 Tax=Stenotrophomonas maltophilia group sp. Smal32 TaxID=3377164 RepID=UPI0018D3940D|nr:hypothetical protein [Stenotrophomonas maltophilia]MBH1747351.1 hypothetical protein [Stenotrophomonas maltophilia]
MNAVIPYRAVSAVEELQGIAVLMGQRAGKPAEVAVLQLQDAIAELINEASRCCDGGGDLSDLRAAVARVKGGAA